MKPTFRINSILALLAAGAIGSGNAKAALAIYEPFADADASLAGNSNSAPGFGLSGTWTATASWDVISGSSSWGSLGTAGNRQQSDSGGAASIPIPVATLSTPGLLNDGATLWFSLIYTTAPTVSGNPDAGFALATNSMGSTNNVPISGGEGIGFTIKTGVMSASTWVGGSVVRATTAAASEPVVGSTTYFVVGEIIWGADGATADTINLYRPGTNLALGAVVATTSAVVNQAAFDTLTFANKGDAGAFPITIDEIRFGTSYLDVSPAIPEPSAALLGGLGALMLLRRRR